MSVSCVSVFLLLRRQSINLNQLSLFLEVYACTRVSISTSELSSCRNFPQGTISDMVKDVSQGISFVCKNIADYGGDQDRWLNNFFIFPFFIICSLSYYFILPHLNRIFLMGQSAGAHISVCALLEQAVKAGKGESVDWSVSQIKSYFGLSGG